MSRNASNGFRPVRGALRRLRPDIPAVRAAWVVGDVEDLYRNIHPSIRERDMLDGLPGTNGDLKEDLQ